MCDPGEKISQTLKREFYEEAFQALNLAPEKRDYLEKVYNDFFENGVEVNLATYALGRITIN
jgi:hypothetical protein